MPRNIEADIANYKRIYGEMLNELEHAIHNSCSELSRRKRFTMAILRAKLRAMANGYSTVDIDIWAVWI